ncbi:RNA polymerase sigma factor [Enhygromyxa salina]|uniref:RNA polymerase sigma factor n=1 Tax=Enhygromyxa salina TaxID=215803 RepID=A0A2S9YF16_9BACT|nr:sigma factor-like helix-turn-helix DNA-binding protein [Enhygromyxa salina]PRQ03632.1 RNA polymerase sigma factor [Enhygromyxa salina]
MAKAPDPAELLAGNPDAIAAFRKLLRAHIRGYFNRESQIHDVSHDALLDLLAKLDAGAQPKHVHYWVLNSANNAVRRELTRLRHQAIEYQSSVHGPRFDPADHASLLDAREDLRKINALLADCDEVPYRALAGAVEGRDHNEIAQELGISPGAARMTLSRARAALSDRFTAQQKIDQLILLARRAGLVGDAGPEPPSSATT